MTHRPNDHQGEGWYVRALSAEWKDKEQEWEISAEFYGPFDSVYAMRCMVNLSEQERIRGAVAEWIEHPNDIESIRGHESDDRGEHPSEENGEDGL